MTPTPDRMDLALVEQLCEAMTELIRLRRIYAGLEAGACWRGELWEAQDRVNALRVHLAPWLETAL
jgi:hypothetical protein